MNPEPASESMRLQKSHELQKVQIKWSSQVHVHVHVHAPTSMSRSSTFCVLKSVFV